MHPIAQGGRQPASGGKNFNSNDGLHQLPYYDLFKFFFFINKNIFILVNFNLEFFFSF